MLTYNNCLKPLALPEYGRNIQQMVDFCTAIADRDERNRCAAAIIDTMLLLFPAMGDKEEYIRKLWDHIIIMSDYKLDIDLPYAAPDPASFVERPEPMVRPESTPMRFRHYGAYIARLVDMAAEMPEGDERDALIMLTANQMKKVMLAGNRDGVEDERIFADMRVMSHGAINLDPVTTRLHEFRQAPTPSGKKKKKR